MENIQSQPEQGEETPVEQRISRNSNTNRRSHAQKFQQAGPGCGIPRHHLTVVVLGLLNAVLLIAAVVIAIYCANANEDHLQTPHSAVSSLIIERNYLRNQSGILKAAQDADSALVREQTRHVQLKLQLKQQKTVSDVLQREIEVFQTEKANLQSKKVTLEESCSRCPSGWTLLKSTCYYFSLSEHDSEKNWPDSRADCLGRGGDLLVIDNLQEQILISENAPKTSSSSGLWWQKGYWMGLRLMESQRTWVWINNTTQTETGYWRNDQPSSSGPQSGNCAAFFYYADTRKVWYNGNCQEHLYNWICEMAAKPFE
ncbi:C-type lectin domain family 12 member B-like [Dunckerocampus dactyliophorus]|uniref:C-type lectin domain family 12 member B-like n=1 Tax=Dunckerocampus dactyliophorus TaxID=161453 RepID=UPI002406981C|nr:C-type lectin domain family 12 member B-like [Dunckerocampus dactyliophorus]